MGWVDIVLLVLVAAAIVAAVVYTRRHQGGCGCGCSGCANSKTCGKKPE